MMLQRQFQPNWSQQFAIIDATLTEKSHTFMIKPVFI